MAMANDSFSLAKPQQLIAPPDEYEAFYELLAASARGRAFLAEHVRRGRAADTEVLLAALTRIEALVRANTLAAPNAADAVAADGRPRLAVVPTPEQPELPIPSPAAGLAPELVMTPPPVAEPQPPIQFERPIQHAITAAMDQQRLPEPEPPPPAPAVVQEEDKLWTLSDAKLAPPPPDPFAAIMMLSEDERIALFT
jgi:hypothetical protein